MKEYLFHKKTELEKKTNLKGDFLLKSPVNFNKAFEKIYIYHMQSETLYEVSWVHAIE